MRDIKDLHTDTGPSHSLGSVATWTGAVVAASGVLTDLIVSALMSAISALIDVCSRHTEDAEVNHGAKLKSLPVCTSANALWLNKRYRMLVNTHLHMSHWHLWSYHWGTGQCRCNHPVCFYTADLIDTPSVCTRLCLG